MSSADRPWVSVVTKRLLNNASYTRIRDFIESEDVNGRRVTAEWLAGRLGIPLRACLGGLDILTSEGFVFRHVRPDGPPWFECVPRTSNTSGRRVGLGIVVLIASIAVVVAGAMLQHVLYFALGLGLGLMIAISWLDWEMRARL